MSKIKIHFLLVFAFTSLFSCKKEQVDTRPKDIDGNIYDTVVIGTQTWMVQNLKTTKYNDGTPIITNLSNTDWGITTSGAFTFYNDSIKYKEIYGNLYNWYAVNTGKLAPEGWHVPTNAEWTTLTTYLGGEIIAGDKMKATTLWKPGAGITNTNTSGFTGLPAGHRSSSGAFNYVGAYGFFWSSTEGTTGTAVARRLLYEISNAGSSNYYKENGFSVRCVRD